MVKYKLIKCYPNSPKLGSVIMDTNPNNGAQDMWFEESWGKGGSQSFMLPKSTNPEKYPEFWEEVKEPLFITTDGVKIYSEDHAWIVYDNFTLSEGVFFTKVKMFDSLKYFSTKEKAESYIKENKPVYSKKQLLDKIEEIYKKLSIEFEFDSRATVVNYCLHTLRKEMGGEW